MTIASEITRIQTNIANAYTAASGKGATIPATENSDNLATCIASIPSGGGGSGKYQLLERVKDDSNNEIGTVSGFFTDANDVEYAVVCLDAQYRNASAVVCSNQSVVTNLPIYNTLAVWTATDTATFNTQTILDYCTANNYSSTACEHCRSKSFVIDGTTYYGQLSSETELVNILQNRVRINAADTSAASNPTLIVPDGTGICSSTYNNNGTVWGWLANGRTAVNGSNIGFFILPVLEIPNN